MVVVMMMVITLAMEHNLTLEIFWGNEIKEDNDKSFILARRNIITTEPILYILPGFVISVIAPASWPGI